MKINQSLVTKTFQCRNGTMGSYYDLDDVHCIKDVLTKNLGISISESEVIDFWVWRSNEWDSSWLSHISSDEILEFFQKFIKFVGVETDEEEEDIPEPLESEPNGIDVTVKDDDGVEWIVQLDPDYYTQIMNEIESQLPGERVEGGSLRFKIDYDPTKIRKIRKFCEEPMKSGI
jgi:hypothetical protein